MQADELRSNRLTGKEGIRKGDQSGASISSCLKLYIEAKSHSLRAILFQLFYLSFFIFLFFVRQG